MEFAQAFRRFGAKVSVIERNGTALKREDGDVSSALADILKEEGVKFFTFTAISKVSGTSGQSVNLADTQDDRPFDITGTHFLVAGGRVPNTKDTGLEAAGIELTPSGHVGVNGYLQTNVPGVFAVGDPHISHTLGSTTSALSAIF